MTIPATPRALLLSLLLGLACACADPDSNGTPEPAPEPDLSRVEEMGDALDLGAPIDLVDIADGIEPADLPDAAKDLEETPPDLRADLPPDMPEVERPLEGFGALMGECDVLDTELTDSSAHLFENTLDFADDVYDDTDEARLSPGGQAILAAGNAGGSSLLSEVFAFEVLHRCEGAALLKTETEVTYQNPNGKITDLLVRLDGERVGVSVVRAIQFPFDEPYPYDRAYSILEDKLTDVLASSANVEASDAWNKQILSVIAYTPQHAEQIRAAWGDLPAEVTADTIVYVTVTEGEDAPLYFND